MKFTILYVIYSSNFSTHPQFLVIFENNLGALLVTLTYSDAKTKTINPLKAKGFFPSIFEI